MKKGGAFRDTAGTKKAKAFFTRVATAKIRFSFKFPKFQAKKNDL